MEHVDPDALALVALGEPPSATDRAHLDSCPVCAAEVASLADVVAVGRSVRPADVLVPPSPVVWERIRAELGLEAGTGAGAVAGAAGSTASGTTTASGTGTSAPPTSGTERPGTTTVVPLRRRPAPWVAAAAASGLVVGAAGGAWWAGRDVVPEQGVVAQAPLEPLPGWDATGSARVEEDVDGGRTLVVTLDGDGTDDGYHEVWLIDREVTRLVSLGVLTGSEGRFTVPPSLDLAEFPVVDVSDEPLDGDPSHSGQSIIRGVLDA